jgi:hypothetical protein
LQYYYSRAMGVVEKQVANKNNDSQCDDNDDTTKLQQAAASKLSLEDEIAMLKRLNDTRTTSRRSDLPFREYETGCRGTVFLLYTGAAAAAEEGKSDKPADHQTSADTTSDGEPCTKKPRIETDSCDATSQSIAKAATKTSSWHVLPTVLAVFQDLVAEAAAGAGNDNDDNDGATEKTEATLATNPSTSSSTNSHIPTSRFMTRMIPIQATCFASLTEIQDTVALLMQEHDSTSTSKLTFAIQTKRRCLDHLTSHDMIQAIGRQVSVDRPNWKVDLRQPQVTVVVETCKSLVGISLLSSDYLSVVRNFNLAEIRAQVGMAATE